MSSTAKPRQSGGSARRKSTGSLGGSASDQNNSNNELIVSRGLQEILEQEVAKRRGSTGSTSNSATKRKKGSTGGAGRSTGPSFVICYLCGRQFGTASVDIHRPQCYLKKMIEWQRGDPALRGPKPIDPETHEKQIKARMAAGGADVAVGGGARAGKRGGAPEIDAYNAAQFEAFQTQALSPCPNCGRTFLPDRLQVHLRSCKPGDTAKPPPRAGAGANARAGPSSPGPAARGPAVDQPTRASGASHVDAAAGAGDVPPKSSSASQAAARSPNPSQPRGAAEEQPIKASGAYAIPEEATADSVPPSDGRAASGGGAGSAVKARAVSHRPSASRRTPTRIDATKAEEDSDGGSEVAFVEEVGEEALPISPSAAVVAAEEERNEAEAQRRHPIAGESGGTSTPTRYASMEPGLDDDEAPDDRRLEFHNYVAAEREVSGAAPEHDPQDAANAVRAAVDNESDAVVVDVAAADKDVNEAKADEPPRRRSGLPSLEERRRMAAENARRNSGTVSEEVVEDEGGEGGEDGKRKIPLNNVSRFKNVQSRLKLEQQQQKVSLTPCKHCGRTFNPARIAKHESCCLERNKAPSPTVNRTAKAPRAKPSSSGPGPARAAAPAAASTTAASAPSPPSGPRFCGECGTKYGAEGQKFCSSCGAKCEV